VKAYRESTSNLRNEAGADAAALECQDIYETLHWHRLGGPYELVHERFSITIRIPGIPDPIPMDGIVIYPSI
jgi:hypothetical protein